MINNSKLENKIILEERKMYITKLITKIIKINTNIIRNYVVVDQKYYD